MEEARTIARIWVHTYEVKGIADLRKRAKQLEKQFPIGVVKMWNGDDVDDEREVDGTGVIVAVTFAENLPTILSKINGSFGTLQMTCECAEQYQCLSPLPTDEEVEETSKAMLKEIEDQEMEWLAGLSQALPSNPPSPTPEEPKDLCEEEAAIEAAEDPKEECVACGGIGSEMVAVRVRLDCGGDGSTFHICLECGDQNAELEEAIDLRKRPMMVSFQEFETMTVGSR